MDSKYPDVACKKHPGRTVQVCGCCSTCGKPCGDTVGCPECDYLWDRDISFDDLVAGVGRLPRVALPLDLETLRGAV